MLCARGLERVRKILDCALVLCVRGLERVRQRLDIRLNRSHAGYMCVTVVKLSM